MLRMRLRTLQDIPVDVPLVGSCGMAVDTAPGIVPYVEARGEILFRPVPLDPNDPSPVVLPNLVVDNLGLEDVNLTGNFGCQAAAFGLGAFVSTLTGAIANSFRVGLWNGLCRP